MFQIEIKNIGRIAESFKVFDAQGSRKPAMFETKRDAEEAVRIIEMLRTDSALEYVKVV